MSNERSDIVRIIRTLSIFQAVGVLYPIYSQELIDFPDPAGVINLSSPFYKMG